MIGFGMKIFYINCLIISKLIIILNFISSENHLNDITFRTAIRDSEKEEGLKNDNLSVDN